MAAGDQVRDGTLKGMAWLLSGALAQYLVQFASLLVLARLLSPADFGVTGAAMVVVRLMAIFTELGAGAALVQKPELEEGDVATAGTLSVALGTVMTAAIYSAAELIAGFFAMPALGPVMRIMSVVPLIAALSVVGMSILQRRLRFRAMAKVELVSYAVAYLGVAIPLAFGGWGVWALVWAQLTQVGVQVLTVLVLLPECRRLGFRAASATALLRFGVGHSLARMANALAGQADNLVTGRTLGAEALGLYGRAYQLMSMPAMLLGGVLDKVFFPTMAGMQDDLPGLRRIYLQSVAGCAMFALPASAALIVSAPELIELLLGTQWLTAVPVFQVLCVCLVFRLGYKMSDSLVRAKGAVYRRAWRQGAYAGAVFLGAWLGHFHGVVGVAAGVAAAVTANFLLMLQLSRSLLGFSWREVVGPHLRHLAVGLWVLGTMVAARAGMVAWGAGAAMRFAASMAAGGAALLLVWHLARGLLGAEGRELARLLAAGRSKLGLSTP